MGAKRAKLREVVLVDDDGNPKTKQPVVPLFANGGDADHISIIHVHRIEPIDEGKVGELPPECDEETIRRKWGGGSYRIFAKSSDGVFRGQRTITLSGDPKFESADARRKYRTKMGLDDDPQPSKHAPAPAVGSGFGLAEVVAIITQTHSNQIEMMRLQAAAREREADDRDRRARLEADERERRSKQEAEDARARDREHQALMLQLMKSDKSQDPSAMVKAMMQGIEIATRLGGGDGPQDPLTALASAAGPIVQQAMMQQQQQPAAAPSPAGPAPASPPAAPAGPSVRLTGQTAGKLIAAAKHLKVLGVDPTAWLEWVCEQALAVKKPVEASPPAPASAATTPTEPTDPPPAPPPQDGGGKETPAKRSATARA